MNYQRLIILIVVFLILILYIYFLIKYIKIFLALGLRHKD